jgi:hypothetical protein
MRESGYRRLDIQLCPRLYKRLMPYIKEYGGENQPGQAIIKLLEIALIIGKRKNRNKKTELN